MLGLSPSYLRRLLRTKVAGDGEADGIKIDSTGAWQLSKDAVRRIAEHREPPKVVCGYDLTFSVPKSVSVLWAGADERDACRGPRRARRGGGGGPPLHGAPRLQGRDPEEAAQSHRDGRGGLPPPDVTCPRTAAPSPRRRRELRDRSRREVPGARLALSLPSREDGELPRRRRASSPAHRAPRCRMDGRRERHRRDRRCPSGCPRRDEFALEGDRRGRGSARGVLGEGASGRGMGHPCREGARRRPRGVVRLVGRAAHRRRLRVERSGVR